MADHSDARVCRGCTGVVCYRSLELGETLGLRFSHLRFEIPPYIEVHGDEIRGVRRPWGGGLPAQDTSSEVASQPLQSQSGSVSRRPILLEPICVVPDIVLPLVIAQLLPKLLQHCRVAVLINSGGESIRGLEEKRSHNTTCTDRAPSGDLAVK